MIYNKKKEHKITDCIRHGCFPYLFSKLLQLCQVNENFYWTAFLRSNHTFFTERDLDPRPGHYLVLFLTLFFTLGYMPGVIVLLKENFLGPKLRLVADYNRISTRKSFASFILPSTH